MAKRKEKKKTSYICPHCKEKQTSVVEWETVSEAYEYNLSTNESEYRETVGEDHESWNCLGCGEELPYSLTKELNLY